MFDISSLVLSAMQSKEEKMNYIIQCMSKNIDDSLDKWTQRLYHQEKKDQEFNLKYEQDKQINFQEKRDVFEWLKIKSKLI